MATRHQHPADRSGRPAALRSRPLERPSRRSSRRCSCRSTAISTPTSGTCCWTWSRGCKALWRRSDGLSLCFSASGTSGMEAGFSNLVEPGDTVLVLHAGFFGARIAEMARRAGADLVELTAPLGQIVPLEQVADALAKHPDTKLVGVVHAETSTGVRYPVRGARAGDRRAAAPTTRSCWWTASRRSAARRSPPPHGASTTPTPARRSRSAVRPGLSPFSVSPRALERDRATARPRVVLLRHRAAREVLDRAADHVPPHDADPAVLRAVRGHPARARGGTRGAVGAARGRRPVLPAADARPRLHVPLRSRAPARGSSRRSTCPRAWTARRSRRGSCGSSASRWAAGSDRPRRRSGALD